jgi:hypothetical protein
MVMNEMIHASVQPGLRIQLGIRVRIPVQFVRPRKQSLINYKNIFHEELPEGLPPKRVVDHAIDTGDHSQSAYQLSV